MRLSRSITVRIWSRNPQERGRKAHQDSKSNAMPRASRIRRLVRTAPNGDLFVAESEPGIIKVFRGITPDGKMRETSDFATGLNMPFGIALSARPEPAISMSATWIR